MGFKHDIPSECGLAGKTRWGLNMIILSERGLAGKIRWSLNMIIPSERGLAGVTRWGLNLSERSLAGETYIHCCWPYSTHSQPGYYNIG